MPPRPDTQNTIEITLDDRARCSLARIHTKPYTRYQAEELPDGRIILTPIVSIYPQDLAAWKDPEMADLMRQIERGERPPTVKHERS